MKVINPSTMEVSEAAPSQPAQQVTIALVPQTNRRWFRQVQLSSEYVFIKRPGSQTVGFRLDDLIALAVKVETSLSHPPLFVTNDVVNGDKLEFQAVFTSELPISYRWQEKTGNEWLDMDGRITSTLFMDNSPEMAGKSFRCVATNAAGQTVSETIAAK